MNMWSTSGIIFRNETRYTCMIHVQFFPTLLHRNNCFIQSILDMT